MPYSSQECKPEILSWFSTRTDIFKILDVGCGAATYPKLLGRGAYLWEGIEIWEPYVEQFELRKWYDKLHVAGFFDVINKVSADCVIFGDVLEHMERHDAVMAIELANVMFPHVVISIPVNYPQEATENPYEEHRHVWTMDEINSVVPGTFAVRGLSWDIALFIK